MEMHKSHVCLTFNLHDLAVLRTGDECMVQVFPCIPPFHFKLDCFLFDLAVVLNASHGHAANAIKRHLQHDDLIAKTVETCLSRFCPREPAQGNLAKGDGGAETARASFLLLRECSARGQVAA